MPSGKYLVGLIAIITVVWLTMIFCLVIVYLLLPPLEQLPSWGVDIVIVAVIRIIVAGSILLAWLYLWNSLVRVYFWRNLIKRQSRPTAGSSKKHG